MPVRRAGTPCQSSCGVAVQPARPLQCDTTGLAGFPSADRQTIVHLHLDPVGGIAGDVFVAALLDALPELEPTVVSLLDAIDLPNGVAAERRDHTDGILTGSRFVVDVPALPHEHGPHDEPDHDGPRRHEHHHGRDGDHDDDHEQRGHRHVGDILDWLQSSVADAGVLARAIDIFEILAVAEATIHGTDPTDVSFHEIGAWDSIVDIVAAATVIEHSGATSWSVGPLPTGSGRVASAHGLLPVPAPAVVLLLEGFVVFDDGRPGERVTPTGAAILRHLRAVSAPPATPMIQGRTGSGFGTKRFEGIANIVRVRELCPVGATAPSMTPTTDEVAVIEFEIDDQGAEDLAVGLDHLRADPGVLDVVQTPGTGKRGRMVAQVRLLVEPADATAIIDRCFAETTTLGVRVTTVERRILPRTSVEADGRQVKLARRPGAGSATVTAKTEIADVDALRSHSERDAARLTSAAAALADAPAPGPNPVAPSETP